MKIPNPFHKGEIEVQKELGEYDLALLNGRLYEDSIIPGAKKFVTELSYILATFYTGDFASIVLTGAPGFISISDDTKNVSIAINPKLYSDKNYFFKNMAVGLPIGMLAIDLSTRRRFRMNGKIHFVSNERIEILISQAYPNCPKHIQKRLISESHLVKNSTNNSFREGKGLDEKIEKIINEADTFFISSCLPGGDADISHRGGDKGFVIIDRRDTNDQFTLRIPDYPGNSLFNTFGNLKLNSKCNLLFWNFQDNSFCVLLGNAQVIHGDVYKRDDNLNSGRYLSFTCEQWTYEGSSIELKLDFVENSKNNPAVTCDT